MRNHSQPAFPLTRRKHEFDGVGGYAANSARIPLGSAVAYVSGTAAVIWAAMGFARLIWS